MTHTIHMVNELYTHIYTHTFIYKEKVHIDLWDLLEVHVIEWLREAYYSSRGPEFSFQNPHQAAQHCL